MITFHRTLTVSKNTASLDEPIYMFRGDGDILIILDLIKTIRNMKFGKVLSTNMITDGLIYSTVCIYKPSGELAFVANGEIVENQMQVTLLKDVMDEVIEIGEHKLQIHLFDEDENRLTLPEVGQIYIAEPLCENSHTAIVGRSTVGTCVVADDPATLTDGYLTYDWQTGEYITSSKLNNMIMGIDEALSSIKIVPNGSITYKKLNSELNSLFIPYYSKQLNFEWEENYAIKYDGSIAEHTGYRYCKYPVTESEVYKIKNQRMYNYVSWLIIDNNNNVLLTDKIEYDMSMVPFEDEIEIPAGGMFLYFNDYQNSFEFLSKTKYELKPSEINFEDLPKEIKDNFEEVFNDVTESMNWIAGSYIKSDGTFVDSDEHAYSVIDVKEGLEIKITGKHSWDISCFVVKDNLDAVVLEDGGEKGEITSFSNFTFTMPVGGSKLYVNKYGFENLQIKNKIRIIQNIKSPLENKTILFTGDSICAGAIEISTGVYDGQYGWPEIIKENNPLATVKNYGVGGSTVALQEDTSKNILTRIDTMYSDYPDADYIILEGGVNDSYSSSISLGEISEGYNAALDEQTFCGALESLFKKCILKWKGKKIGYIVTFKVPTADDSDFESYMLKAKQICEKWSIPYIDLYTQSGLEYHIDEIKELYSYGGGGLHPNIEGYKIITPKIENWIKSL